MKRIIIIGADASKDNATHHKEDNKPPEQTEVKAMISDKITLSDGATIENTPEALHDYNQMRKAAFEKMRQQEALKRSRATGKYCPFQYDVNMGHAKECSRDCVFFLDNACAFTACSAEYDTVGKPCPFMRKCAPSCALYNGGCTIIDIMGMKPERKV